MAKTQTTDTAAHDVRGLVRSIPDLAFYALRARTPRGVLLKLSAAFVLLLAVMWGAYAFTFRDALSVFAHVYIQSIRAAATHGSGLDFANIAFPAEAPAAAALFVICCLAQYAALAAYEAGCLRWIMRGDVGGAWGMALGAQTWRVLGVHLVWLALRITAAILFAAVTQILSAVFGGPGSADGVIVAWQVAQDFIILYFAVRLSPASAATIGRGRFSFFEAWRVTRGRFWPMLAAFVLLFLILCLVGVFTVGGALWAVYGESAQRVVDAAETRDIETMIRVLITPLHSVGSLAMLGIALLANQAISLVFYVLFFGINARVVLLAAAEGKIDAVAPAPAPAH